jgi:hypothetical protein
VETACSCQLGQGQPRQLDFGRGEQIRPQEVVAEFDS